MVLSENQSKTNYNLEDIDQVRWGVVVVRVVSGMRATNIYMSR